MNQAVSDDPLFNICESMNNFKSISIKKLLTDNKIYNEVYKLKPIKNTLGQNTYKDLQHELNNFILDILICSIIERLNLNKHMDHTNRHYLFKKLRDECKYENSKLDFLLDSDLGDLIEEIIGGISQINQIMDIPFIMSLYSRLFSGQSSNAEYSGSVAGDLIDEKKDNGVFYTPKPIAEFMTTIVVKSKLERIIDNMGTILQSIHDADVKDKKSLLKELRHNFDKYLSIRIIDPSCGIGIFLFESLLRFHELFPRFYDIVKRYNNLISDSSLTNKQDLYLQDFEEGEYLRHVVWNQLYGVDIDGLAVKLTSFILSLYCGFPRGNLSTTFDLNIKTGNSLISLNDSLLSHFRNQSVTDIITLRKDIQRNKTRNNVDPNILTKKIAQEYDEILVKSYKDIISKKPFHWELEFPEVYLDDPENAGFDIILMNPPYNLKRICSEGTDLESSEKNTDRKMGIQQEVKYFRKCGLYDFSLDGVLNTYKLMLERSFKMSRRNGELCFIVPNTILGDLSTKRMRGWIFKNMTIENIFTFSENTSLFGNVTQAFAIIKLTNKTDFPYFSMSAMKLKDDLMKKTRSTIINKNDIYRLFPFSLSIPCISQTGWNILQKIHSNRPLRNIQEIKNLRGELDLTFFRNAIRSDPTEYRLIRGNHIRRYHICWNNDEKPSYVEIREFRRMNGASAKMEHLKYSRIVGKQVANMDKGRRLEFTLCPSNHIVANSCNYLFFDGTSNKENLIILLAFLNSSLMEWRFRLASTNNHINNYQLDELPIIDPNSKQLLSLKNLLISSVEALLGMYSRKKVNKNEVAQKEKEIDAMIFSAYSLDVDETRYIMRDLNIDSRTISLVISKKLEYDKISNRSIDKPYGLYNHHTANLSEIDKRMVMSIPAGGNWRNIPTSISSERVSQIRKSGGRTTYYGRLTYDKPSYTVSTYFNRPGNGCYIHPEQDRLISVREAARLQSFSDRFVFLGSKTSIYNQIGNAVPVLLAKAIAEKIPLTNATFIDLFCGAGGMAVGFIMAGFECLWGIDSDLNSCKTFARNFDFRISERPQRSTITQGDIGTISAKDALSSIGSIDVIIGGPPCQGFSTAGYRFLDDPRNRLVKEFIKWVAVIRPKYFVMENVLGLLSFNEGNTMKELIDAFGKNGYSIDYKVLNSEDYGVPQKRHRLIIIGSMNGSIQFPDPLFKDGALDLPSFITVRDAISDLPPLIPGAGSFGPIEYPHSNLSPYQKLLRGRISFDSFYKEMKDQKSLG